MPQQNTIIKTLKKDIENIHKESNNLTKENEDIIKQYELYMTRQNKLYSQIKLAKEQIEQIKYTVALELVENGSVPWDYILDTGLKGSHDLLNKCLKHSCLEINGYNPDNNKDSLKFTLTKRTKQKNIMKTASFLKEYVKHSKPILLHVELEYQHKFDSKKDINLDIENNTVNLIGIFENSLSDGGSYILIFIQNVWAVVVINAVVVISFRTAKILYTNENIEDTLNYIKEYHYYYY